MSEQTAAIEKRIRRLLVGFFGLIVANCLSSTAEAKMQFTSGYSGGNCSDCAWVAAQGIIEPNDAARFEAFMRDHYAEYEGLRGGWLFVNSTGGSLAEGLAIGRLVRKYGMSVRVAATFQFEPEGAGREFQSYKGGTCASACVFILMGGVEREVHSESRVGIHQFNVSADRSVREQAALSSAQSILAGLSSYAANMGVSPDLISMASAVDASNMLWLTRRQMEQSRLVTTIETVEEAEWRLQPQGAALVAEAIQSQDSGVSIGFRIACSAATNWHISLLVPRPPSTDQVRWAEIAASVEQVGLGQRWDATYELGPYPFKSTASREGFLLRFALPSAAINRIASSAHPIFVKLMAPHAFYDEMSGQSYLLPRSNLTDLIQHVSRSCR